MIKNAIEDALRAVAAVFGWLLKTAYRELWSKPAAIRGIPWTAALWTYVACGLYLSDVLARSGKPVALPMVLLIVASLVMKHTSKPKRLGRQLPYRRQRGRRH